MQQRRTESLQELLSDQRSILVKQLASISGFAKMAPDERWAWLEKHAAPEQLGMQDIDGVLVRLVSSGKSSGDLAKADQDQVSAIMNRPRVHPEDIEELVKPLPSARTLFLLTSRWRVDTSCLFVSEARFVADYSSKGALLLSTTSSVVVKKEGSQDKLQKHVIVVPELKVGFLVLGEDAKHDPLATNRLALLTRMEAEGHLPSGMAVKYEILAKHLCNHGFQSGAWKSLLQKTIRFGAKWVTFASLGSAFGDWRVPASDFAAVCFVCLLTHPGNLVPDIQRFVTGLEAAVKRTLVCLYEDSWFDTQDEDVCKTLEEMATAAWLVQLCPTWRPTSSQALRWSRVAVAAHASCHTFKRPGSLAMSASASSRPNSYRVVSRQSRLGRISAILDKVGSFTGDLAIIHHVAICHDKGQDSKAPSSGAASRPEEMPIEHCVDQHWAPDIVYHMRSDWVKSVSSSRLSDKGSKGGKGSGFERVLSLVFGSVTGFNPRSCQDITEQPEIRQAQARLMSVMTAEPSTTDTASNDSEVTYQLHKGWLSGMLGPVSICKNKVFATLGINDPSNLSTASVFRKPASMRASSATKEAAEAKMSPQEEKDARADFKCKLETGIMVLSDRDAIPMDEWRRTRVKLTSGGRLLLSLPSQEWQDWEDARNIKMHVSSETAARLDVKHLAHLLSTVDISVRHALKHHMRGVFGSVLAMPRLSRDGTCQHGGISGWADVAAFEFLRSLARMIPGMMVPKPVNGAAFDIVNRPLFWLLRDRLDEAFMHLSNQDESDIKCLLSKSGPGRALFDYQQDAIAECLERQGRGNILVQTTGTGKTAVAMGVMANMDKIKPKYMIVTTPSAAVPAIVAEAKRWLPSEGKTLAGIRILLGSKSIPADFPAHLRSIVRLASDEKGFVPLAGGVTIVRHDCVRKCVKTLLGFSSESMLVIDEMHKALGESQRTNSLQQLAATCPALLMMTGTLVPDAKSANLRWWLQRISPFAVTPSNVWVAMTQAVNKQVNEGKGVWQHRYLRDVDWVHAADQERYLKLLSSKRGGSNPCMNMKDLMQAFDLCVSNSELVLARLVAKALAEPGQPRRGAYMVAKNQEHARKLKSEVERQLVAQGVSSKIIGAGVRVLTGSGDSIDLSPSEVDAGRTPNFCVLISTLTQSEGFNAHHLDMMATTIFHDSFPVRAQHQGRVKRVGRRHHEIPLFLVTTGMQEWWFDAQADDSARAAVFATLGDVIGKDGEF